MSNVSFCPRHLGELLMSRCLLFSRRCGYVGAPHLQQGPFVPGVSLRDPMEHAVSSSEGSEHAELRVAPYA